MPDVALSEILLAAVSVIVSPVAINELFNIMLPLVFRLMSPADVAFTGVAVVRSRVMPPSPAVMLILPPVALVPFEVVRLDLLARKPPEPVVMLRLPPLSLVRFEFSILTVLLLILRPPVPFVVSALPSNDVVPVPLCCSKDPRVDDVAVAKVTSFAFVMTRLTLVRSSWAAKTMFSSAVSVRVGVFPFVVLDSAAAKLIEPHGTPVLATQSLALVVLAVVIVTLVPAFS